MWHAGLSDWVLLLGCLHPHRAFDSALVKIEITYSFLGAGCKRILIPEFRLIFELVEFSFFESGLLHRRDNLGYLHRFLLFLIRHLTLLRWLPFNLLLIIRFFFLVCALLLILVRRRNSTLWLLLLDFQPELLVLLIEYLVALLDALIVLLIRTQLLIILPKFLDGLLIGILLGILYEVSLIEYFGLSSRELGFPHFVGPFEILRWVLNHGYHFVQRFEIIVFFFLLAHLFKYSRFISFAVLKLWFFIVHLVFKGCYFVSLLLDKFDVVFVDLFDVGKLVLHLTFLLLDGRALVKDLLLRLQYLMELSRQLLYALLLIVI